MTIGIHVTPDGLYGVELAGGLGVPRLIRGPVLPDAVRMSDCVEGVLSQEQGAGEGWRRSEVVVGLHADYSQFSKLWNFPPTKKEGVGSALLRENASRFFRLSPQGLSTSSVKRRADGSVWAAATDLDIVREIESACAMRGIALRGIVPADSVEVGQECPKELRESSFSTAWRLAKLAQSTGEIDFNTSTGDRTALRGTRRRERLARAALLVSCGFFAVCPVVDARRIARDARQEYAELSARESTALTVANELARIDEELTAIAEAAALRRHHLDVLASLTAALPTGSVMTNLRLDSLGGSLTVLAPSADEILRRLSASPLVVEPELVGPVLVTTVAGRELNRLSLKFRHPVRTTIRESN